MSFDSKSVCDIQIFRQIADAKFFKSSRFKKHFFVKQFIHHTGVMLFLTEIFFFSKLGSLHHGPVRARAKTVQYGNHYERK